MRCKVICRDFDRECEFLQGTYNGAAFTSGPKTVTQFFNVMNIIWTRYHEAVLQDGGASFSIRMCTVLMTYEKPLRVTMLGLSSELIHNVTSWA